MKKYRIPVFILLIIIFGSVFTIQSCRKISDFKNIDSLLEEEFNEVYNLSDNIYIDGSVAVPILNTKFSLGNFVPDDLDSTFWVEIDPSTNPDDEYYNLMHLRMYFKDVFTIQADQFFNISGFPFIPDTSIHFVTDTSKMKVYEHALTGHLFFKDPRITVKFFNEFPLNAFVNLDTIFFYDEDLSMITNTEINIEHAFEEAGNTELLLNTSNIDILGDLFSPIPKYLGFAVTGGFTEMQQIPNFTGDEKLSIDVDIDLPMNAKLVDFAIGDTIDFSFADSNNIEQIEAITIKLMFDNFIPAGGVSKIIFCDTNQIGGIDQNNRRDSIIDGDDGALLSFLPAETTGTGKPINSVKSDFTIHLTQENINTIVEHDSTKIIFVGTFESDDSPNRFVKIFSWCELGVKLGIKIDYAGSTGDIPQ